MRKRIYFMLVMDFTTSYRNEWVEFRKGDIVWEWDDNIFSCNGIIMILAKNSYGKSLGLLPLDVLTVLHGRSNDWRQTA